MSKATKRKHVTKEVLDEFVLPVGSKQIVRVCFQLILEQILFLLFMLNIFTVTE